MPCTHIRASMASIPWWSSKLSCVQDSLGKGYQDMACTSVCVLTGWKNRAKMWITTCSLFPTLSMVVHRSPREQELKPCLFCLFHTFLVLFPLYLKMIMKTLKMDCFCSLLLQLFIEKQLVCAYENFEWADFSFQQQCMQLCGKTWRASLTSLRYTNEQGARQLHNYIILFFDKTIQWPPMCQKFRPYIYVLAASVSSIFTAEIFFPHKDLR